MKESHRKSDSPVLFKQKLFLSIPPILLLLLNLFIFGTATIYLNNNLDFSSSLIQILLYNLFLILILFAGLQLLALITPARYHKFIVSILFSFGILTWIQGNLIIWNYGAFTGVQIDWSTYPWRGYIDAGLWIVCIASAVIFAAEFIKISSFVSVVLIILQSIPLMFSFLTSPGSWQTASSSSVLSDSITGYSSSFNLIHILMDSFQTDIFEEIVQENKFEDALDGFTLYRENIASFAYTHYSLPALFSADIYPGRGSRPEFIEKSLSKNGFFNILYKNKYKVNFISASPAPSKNITNNYTVPNIYSSDADERRLNDVTFLLDITLFRHLPHYFKKILYNNQSWTIKPAFAKGAKVGYFHYREMFKDYIAKIHIDFNEPAYHYIHLLPPHYPFTCDNNCEYAGGLLSGDRDNFKVECRCNMVQFFNLNV